SDFNFANQPGIPWQVDTSDAANPVSFTDWQIYDVAPGDSFLAVGETVEVEIYASGCSPGGHWGEVYVDGFGAQLPGLSVKKTGPQQTNIDADVTYNFTVHNHTGGLSRNVVVDDVLPRHSTFKSIAANGASCSTPTVDTEGSIVC